MIGRLLAKLGVASSTISGVVYFDIFQASSMRVRSKEKAEQIIEDLKTIEDIELFEKIHGCNFVFVNSWDEKLLYSARTFYEQNDKNEQWKNAIIEVLNTFENGKAKNLCKTQKGVITLFDNQSTKKFRLGEPDERKW